MGGWSHIHVWWIKIGRGTSGTKDLSPGPDHIAQGSSTRKISPHNFCLQKPGRVGMAEETVGFSRDSLKGPETDLGLTQTYPLWDSAPGQELRAQVAYGEKGRK